MIGSIGGTARRTLWIVVVVAVFGGHFLTAAIGGLTNLQFGKHYDLPNANLTAVAQPSGAVDVTEALTFSFHGQFSGAYQDIAYSPGQSVTGVSVTQGGIQYQPGANTVLGSFGTPDSFGVASLVDADGHPYTRVVWHYSAIDEQRTFTIHYTVQHAAVAHTDVTSVNWFPWGPGWAESLDHLTATVIVPRTVKAGTVRGFGHPGWVNPVVQPAQPLGAQTAITMNASSIPAHQAVQFRVVYPRPAGQPVDQSGNALPGILADEAKTAAAWSKTKQQYDSWKNSPLKLYGLTALAATVPALLLILLIYQMFGKELAPEAAVQYVREPPSDDQPALVRSLVDQHAEAGSREFAATLFDLIRRKALTGKPTPDNDLEVSAVADRDSVDLTDFEQQVVNVISLYEQGEGGPFSLKGMSSGVRSSSKRDSISTHYQTFLAQSKQAVRAKGWLDDEGTYVHWLATAVFAVLTVAVIAAWLHYKTPAHPLRGLALESASAAAAGNTLLLLLVPRKMVRRRSPAAAALGRQWDAFARFLHDFPKLSDQPPASIELWDKMLVYGIVFGCADRLAEAGRGLLTDDQRQTSAFPAVFWLYPLGFGGFDGLGSNLGSSFTPTPHVSTGGGGGGFSGGGGGGGFGGGGGGAW